MLLMFSIRVGELPPVRKELFIRFTVRMFRERLSVYVCASFLFGFDGRMWDLFVFVPDSYFSSILYDNLAFSRLKSLKMGCCPFCSLP